jgi:hypothetical protein
MDGVGYGIDLPVERTLAPGASTRIRLLIRSDKSSANRLRFVLKANGSDVESNVIDLLAFVARR